MLRLSPRPFHNLDRHSPISRRLQQERRYPVAMAPDSAVLLRELTAAEEDHAAPFCGSLKCEIEQVSGGARVDNLDGRSRARHDRPIAELRHPAMPSLPQQFLESPSDEADGPDLPSDPDIRKRWRPMTARRFHGVDGLKQLLRRITPTVVTEREDLKRLVLAHGGRSYGGCRFEQSCESPGPTAALETCGHKHDISMSIPQWVVGTLIPPLHLDGRIRPE